VDAERVWPHTYRILPWKQNFFFVRVSPSPSRGAPDRIRSLIIIIRTLCNQCNGAMTFQNFGKLLMIIIITDQGALTSKRPSCTCYKSIKRSIWPRIRRVINFWQRRVRKCMMRIKGSALIFEDSPQPFKISTRFTNSPLQSLKQTSRQPWPV
jgi:hypothetical protein